MKVNITLMSRAEKTPIEWRRFVDDIDAADLDEAYSKAYEKYQNEWFSLSSVTPLEERKMDESTAKKIQFYIPHPRDPELEEGQYYFNQSGRVIKVLPLDILPHDEGTEYGCYQKRGGQLCWVDTAGYGQPFRGCQKADLYDNKQDCHDRTHACYNNWEELRRIQENGTTS